jgi:hypothetical protein
MNTYFSSPSLKFFACINTKLCVTENKVNVQYDVGTLLSLGGGGV